VASVFKSFLATEDTEALLVEEKSSRRNNVARASATERWTLKDRGAQPPAASVRDADWKIIILIFDIRLLPLQSKRQLQRFERWALTKLESCGFREFAMFAWASEFCVVRHSPTAGTPAIKPLKKIAPDENHLTTLRTGVMVVQSLP